jgi:hypothetical protein
MPFTNYLDQALVSTSTLAGTLSIGTSAGATVTFTVSPPRGTWLVSTPVPSATITVIPPRGTWTIGVPSDEAVSA